MIVKVGQSLLCLTWLLALSAYLAAAQSPTSGRVSGTVVDETSALVGGAQVTLSNKTTGAERKVTTDLQGNYVVALLPPGTYRVSFALPGFATKIFLTTIMKVIS